MVARNTRKHDNKPFPMADSHSAGYVSLEGGQSERVKKASSLSTNSAFHF